MKNRTAFVGLILFILSFSVIKDKVVANPDVDQNVLAQYRPIPGIQYRRNKWYNRGLKKFQNGDYQGSIDIFSKYIKKYSSTEDKAPSVYFMLAFSKSRLGDHSGAIADYTKAIEMNFKYPPNAYFYRSLSKGTLGDIQGACSDARKSVSFGYENKNYNDWIKNNCSRFK